MISLGTSQAAGICLGRTDGARLLGSLVGFQRVKVHIIFIVAKKIYAKNYKKKTVVRGVNLTTVLVILTVSIVTIVW